MKSMSGKKIKVPRIRVFAINPKEDSKKAKMMEKFINYEYKQHKEFVDAITRARIFIENVFGIKTPNQLWEMILKAYLTDIMNEKILATPKKSSKGGK